MNFMLKEENKWRTIMCKLKILFKNSDKKISLLQMIKTFFKSAWVRYLLYNKLLLLSMINKYLFNTKSNFELYKRKFKL